MEAYKNLSLEDMNGEIWKDVVGFEGKYQVSNMGRVKSLERISKVTSPKGEYHLKIKPKILKQSSTSWGYLRVTLHNGLIKREVKVHRLIAETFIPNIENKPTVDHISTIKTDNRVENLRWATMKEQINENEITKEKHKNTKSIIGKRTIKSAQKACEKKVRCITTNKIFDSIKEASEYYGISRTRISEYCRNVRKMGGKLPDGTKLQWEYID